MKAVQGLAGTMRKMDPEEVEKEIIALPKLGATLRELPYSGLRGAQYHEYGALKAWIKWKNFGNLKNKKNPENIKSDESMKDMKMQHNKQQTKKEWEGMTWSELKFRPLCSYLRHHWRKLLSLGSRFCTTAITTLRWGFHCSSPKQVVRDSDDFNQGFRKTGGSLAMALFDVKEFFPNCEISFLRVAVQAAIEQLREKNGTWNYF
jgi:hypothetical protein